MKTTKQEKITKKEKIKKRNDRGGERCGDEAYSISFIFFEVFLLRDLILKSAYPTARHFA